MKTIKLMMIALMMCFTMMSFGQQRVDRSIAKIGACTNQLITCTGWTSIDGQWVKRLNRIPFIIDNILLDYQEYGLGYDNFISWQIRNVTISDSNYMLLIKKYKDGYYKYPTISEGWTTYNSAQYFIVSKSEMSKFKTFNQNVINCIKLNVLHTGYIDWINNATFLTDIAKDIPAELYTETKDTTDKYQSSIKETLDFNLLSYKNNIRFLIESPSDRLLNDNKGMNVDSLFNTFYYETDMISFNKFINLKQKQ